MIFVCSALLATTEASDTITHIFCFSSTKCSSGGTLDQSSRWYGIYLRGPSCGMLFSEICAPLLPLFAHNFSNFNLIYHWSWQSTSAFTCAKWFLRKQVSKFFLSEWDYEMAINNWIARRFCDVYVWNKILGLRYVDAPVVNWHSFENYVDLRAF